MVIVYAVKGFDGANLPLDNPLQVPAHRYSGRVLASGKEAVRTTPKFERVRLLGDVVFVSGTAAIKGEDSEFSEDTRVQALGSMWWSIWWLLPTYPRIALPSALGTSASTSAARRILSR